jgi:hypothetical protein
MAIGKRFQLSRFDRDGAAAAGTLIALILAGQNARQE